MQGGKSFVTSYWPGAILLVASVLIAWFCFKDYGISWDEPIQREMGEVSYNYAFNGDKGLLTYGDQSHGVAFEMPLIFIERKLHITDTRKIYLMRHLATHLFFLLSVFCGYILALRLFKNQFIACLGFILLAFNPRIYAHSYFNTKDIPFLSALIIVFLVSQVAFEKNRTWWYVLLGIVTAYATSIRAMGIMIALCISLFFIADMLNAFSKKEKTTAILRNFAAFILVFCGFLYATWPILWSAPFHYFKEEFVSLSHILWHGYVLLDGVVYAGDKLPWFYVPLWFCVTIPVLWLIAGFAGTLLIAGSFIRKPATLLLNTPMRNYLLYGICFVVPAVAVIVLHSVNYDDWRHVYFIYPAFVMLVLFAINKFMTGKLKYIIGSACLLQVGLTSYFMVSAHPFQQVYFNELVSHKDEFLRYHYDLEYWGCADKQALEYIAAHDTANPIKVWLSLNPVVNNLMILPEATRNRFLLVDSAGGPTYFMTNFRNHGNDYNYPNVFYEIKVQNSTILRVYKLH
jgi:Dolichyl-phosphate-mannose-protein mannosyltransferase